MNHKHIPNHPAQRPSPERKYITQVTLFAVALPMICGVALAQTPWQPKEYPISYWVGPPKAHNTLATWQRVKDCNFTVCGQYGGYTYAKQPNP